MYIDPDGHMPKWLKNTLKIGGALLLTAALVVGTIFTPSASIVLEATIGAVIGGVTGAITNGIIFENGEVKWDWKSASEGFLIGTISGAITGALGEVFSGFDPIVQCVGNMVASGAIYTLQGVLLKEPVSLEGLVTTISFAGIGSYLGGIHKFGGTILRQTLTSIGLNISESSISELIEFTQSMRYS